MKFKKIEIAPSFEIEQSQDFVDEFLKKIFCIDGALVTDESSLYDFDFQIEDLKVVHYTQQAIDKIKRVYDVDVSDVEDLNLSKILQRIRLLKNL